MHDDVREIGLEREAIEAVDRDGARPCFAPAVFFVGITGNGERWFAVTGW